jgi:hypothetical protein
MRQSLGGHSTMSARAKTGDSTTFLNVDLDISSQQDLVSLPDTLRPRLIALHVGRIGRRYWARFELRRQPNNPDVAIRRLVSAIEHLPVRQRACWKRATTRDFNIGIQAAEEPPHSEFSVDPATVMVSGRVGARIGISVYGAALAKAAASVTMPAKPRMQPAGPKGAGLRAGGILR